MTDQPGPAPLPRLTRPSAGLRPAAPVRIVHLGLGSFFRAHQAWYTDRAPDADRWGIAAFTGRSAGLAETLDEQDGAYTLVTRGPAGSSYEHVAAVSSALPASDHDGWLRHLASPEVVIVTLTVTEAAYRRRPDGSLDLSDADVSHDVAALAAGPAAPVRTVPGRLLAGLMARRAAGAGPLAVVPCDNLAGNGAAVAAAVGAAAAAVDPTLAGWLADQVGFVDTMVDRITPATSPTDLADVASATGFDDQAPVVTEPFSEWRLAGRFPGGRPAWEAAGAHLVPDVAPYERRKLWLLNGAHSLMAYAGSLRGHETIGAAVADPRVRSWVEAWWDEAGPHLQLDDRDVTVYRGALLERFANPRLPHRVAQVAADGSAKIPVRVGPVLRAERAAGRMPRAGARIVAAWVRHVLGEGGATVSDPGLADAGVPVGPGPFEERAAACLRVAAPELADDRELLRTLSELGAELMS